MQIILAAPRGFCAGVNMAIECLEQAIARWGTPIYVYHEIVHNRWVVDGFSSQGVVFVNDVAEVPSGAHLLFSAHGVSPAVRQEVARRRIHAIDATCPLVTKVHREAIRFASEGYTIILIGHAGHEEVLGTMGEAPEAFRLVQTCDDVDGLEIADSTKLAYLTQTTISMLEAAEVIARLRQRFPRIVGPKKDDICYATQNRQEAVRRLAGQADIVLVVGSRNSSNSRRLAERALAGGVPSHLVDGPADIDPAWFTGGQRVLITAGASAPETVVQECVAMLRAKFGGNVCQQTVCEERVSFSLPKSLTKPENQSP
jgi:4-hydroxy-3-methylbut-2-enyl diphosphate reductase